MIKKFLEWLLYLIIGVKPESEKINKFITKDMSESERILYAEELQRLADKEKSK